MIIVTGGAGFIGSNLIRKLNSNGIHEILIIEDLSDGHKIQNIADLKVVDYIDKNDFSTLLASSVTLLGNIDFIFHLGACVDTVQWDGKYMMKENFDYSKRLANFCLLQRIPLIYASSAAVYGNGENFDEDKEYERPLNIYAYSKFLFDQYVRHNISRFESLIVGLRFFNVYGRGEDHKGTMASVIAHFNAQLLSTGKIKVFEGSHGYEAGLQSRDFIHVDDVVNVTFWFLHQARSKSGIYNCGSGKAVTFKTVAEAVIDWHGQGTIEYIPFPDQLIDYYQPFTCANLEKLRIAGYLDNFKDIRKGVEEYLSWLNSSD